MTRAEASQVLLIVQAGRPHPRLKEALEVLGIDPGRFQWLMSKARATEKGRNPLHLLTPTGSGAGR